MSAANPPSGQSKDVDSSLPKCERHGMVTCSACPPTPTSLREQILHIVKTTWFDDRNTRGPEEEADTIMSRVASYIEAAEIDRALTELGALKNKSEVKQWEVQTELGGDWQTIPERIKSLQAQKAVLEEK